jgi:hypothetical protein
MKKRTAIAKLGSVNTIYYMLILGSINIIYSMLILGSVNILDSMLIIQLRRWRWLKYVRRTPPNSLSRTALGWMDTTGEEKPRTTQKDMAQNS